MSMFVSAKATNLRRFLGVVLFSAIIGLGIIMEIAADWSDVLGWAAIVFAGLGLAAWGAVSRPMATSPNPEPPESL